MKKHGIGAFRPALGQNGIPCAISPALVCFVVSTRYELYFDCVGFNFLPRTTSTLELSKYKKSPDLHMCSNISRFQVFIPLDGSASFSLYGGILGLGSGETIDDTCVFLQFCKKKYAVWYSTNNHYTKTYQISMKRNDTKYLFSLMAFLNKLIMWLETSLGLRNFELPKSWMIIN